MMETGKLYVDKTKDIYAFVDKYEAAFTIFPKKFGKSLFLDVIRCYFE